MKKYNYMYRDINDLMAIYTKALEYSIERSFPKKGNMHLEDFMVHVSAFTENFLSIIEAMPND